MNRSFLMDAISYCDLHGINEFLNSGGDVNGYFSGLSPLLFAIQCSNKPSFSPCGEAAWNHLQFYFTKITYDDIIMKLIGAGAEVNIKYPYNLMTPLMLALRYKRSNKVIFELIKAGSNINAECANLKTALFYAVEYNCDLDIITKLLNEGANVNHRCTSGRTPLIYALIYNSNPEIISVFIDAGADINLACLRNETPLMYAVKNKRDKLIVNRLITAGADVNRICDSQKTALFYAAISSEDSEIIGILVSAGCRNDIVCPKGKTPLFYAIENNRINSITKELICCGSDVNHRCKVGSTPLFSAVAIADDEIIMDLFNAGGYVNICDTFGHNVLSYLSRCDNCTEDSCKNKRVINLLFHYGVDFNSVDLHGNSLLHLVNCNYFNGFAVRHGVPIEAKNHSDLTALMDAVFCNDTVKVNNLLQLNANPNCVTSDLNTPLHYFNLVNSDEIINLLLYHGADMHAVNFHNKTPLDLLIECIDNVDILEIGPGLEAITKHFLLFVLEDGLNAFIHGSSNNDRDYDNDNNMEKMSRIYSLIDESKIELCKMRQYFIKDGLLFYDFCVFKKLYRSKFIDITVNEYKYSFKRIKELFPFYQDLIIMRIKDNHYKRCKKVLCNSLEKIVVKPYVSTVVESDVTLNFDCLYQISYYLDNKQLYNFFLSSLMS